MRNFPAYDEHTAPEAARPILLHSRRQFGKVPTPLAHYASSPLLLKTALELLEAFEHSSLAPLEREVVAMTMGHTNGCKFCLTLHASLLRKLDAPPHVTRALEQAEPLPDARLESLRAFVVNALERHGAVDAEVFADFLAKGFSHQQALDVVLGVGAYTVTTFANRLTDSSEA
ncbi:MAG: carboxymuconolactone decarboxylase family protein [Myxococcota bacterium]